MPHRQNAIVEAVYRRMSKSVVWKASTPYILASLDKPLENDFMLLVKTANPGMEFALRNISEGIER